MKKVQNSFWRDKKVLVTGGVEKGAQVSVLDNLENGRMENLQSVKDKVNLIKGDCTDLKTAEEACGGQEVVLNLAARVGGIEYNRTHQATMLRDNLLIGSEGFLDEPEPTNGGYGWAK